MNSSTKNKKKSDNFVCVRVCHCEMWREDEVRDLRASVSDEFPILGQMGANFWCLQSILILFGHKNLWPLEYVRHCQSAYKWGESWTTQRALRDVYWKSIMNDDEMGSLGSSENRVFSGLFHWTCELSELMKISDGYFFLKLKLCYSRRNGKQSNFN